MKRREFITLASSAAAAGALPVGTRAQRPKLPVVGVLSPARNGNERGLIEGLHELGYIDGENVRFEYRWADGNFDRLPDLASELVQLKVDVIVAFVTQAAQSARKQTNSIPIVMVGVSDPVGAGLAASLSHPGGNVTGTSSLAAAVVGKQLELLKLVAADGRGIAAMFNPSNVTFQTLQVNEAKTASARLGLPVRFIEVRAVSEFDGAFDNVARAKDRALLILIDPLFIANAKALAELSVKSRLITMTGYRTFAEAGALMSYGPNYFASYKAAAPYVAKILKGENPADLPVDQSSRFEFVVNMKTAKALGVEIPASVSAFADEIID